MSPRLVKPNSSHIESLQSWFDSQQALSDWGGPHMVFPSSATQFSQAIKINELASYSLIDTEHEFIGFGQFYQRLGRHHYGRVGVCPRFRGHGFGTILLNALMQKAQQQQCAVGHSLFVYEHNVAAIRCYRKLGFTISTYPQKNDNIADCLYMIKD